MTEVIKLTYFQIISLVYLLLVMYKFMKKKKVKTFENYAFETLLILNFLQIVNDIFLVWTSKMFPNYTLMVTINKINMVILMGELTAVTYYANLIMSSHYQGYISIKENGEKKYYSKLMSYYAIGFIIVSLLIIFLPVSFYENNPSYCVGAGIYVGYAALILCMPILIYILISSKNIPLQKKSPFILFIVFATFGGLIQMLVPNLLVIGLICTFTVIYISFTVENPDVNLMETLNITRTQAEKASNAKSDFLSSMSHEIRTPLNAIVGFSHALTEEEISKEAQDEVTDIISSSQNLLEVVNNILDYSKIEASRLQIVPMEYNAHKLFKNLVNYANSKNTDPDIKVESYIDEQLPEVLYGDSVRITQAVQNLISNACKYTKKGTVTFRVKTITLNNICHMYISVEDTGIGIKDEEKDKVFSKFTQGTENYADGSGLGLTITKSLVEMMDGTISLESVFGKGTKFLISINQKVINKTASEINDVDDSDYKIFDGNGKKVLVIDDNTVNLKVAKKMIKEYNIEAELFKSATECIKKIEEGTTYDLILIDDMMPTMTGSEAIKYLRQIPNYNIPTVILTANQTPEVRKQYISIGFDDYLAKPILKPELCAIMNKYLNSNTPFVHVEQKVEIVDENKIDLPKEENKETIQNEKQNTKTHLIENDINLGK